MVYVMGIVIGPNTIYAMGIIIGPNTIYCSLDFGHFRFMEKLFIVVERLCTSEKCYNMKQNCIRVFIRVCRQYLEEVFFFFR